MAQQSLPASSNLNSENRAASLELVDVAEAVALMGELAEGEGNETSPTGSGPADRDAAAPAEDAGEDADAVEESESEEGDGEEGEPEEPSAEGSDAPEFWSAEDKAAWNAVPAELRPVLKKYEQQRVEFVNEKAREAATVRAQAARRGPARQRRRRPGRAVVAAGRPGAAAGLRRQVVAGQLERARREEPGRVGAAQPAAHGRGGRCSPKPTGAAQADIRRRRPSAPSRPSRTPSASSTPSSRTSCPTISAPGDGGQDLRRPRQVPVRQGHPGRPHQRHPRGPDHRAGARRHALRAGPEAGFDRVTEGSVRGEHDRARRHRLASPPDRPLAPATGQSDAARQVGERFRKSGGDSIADAAELIRLNGLVIRPQRTLTTGGCNGCTDQYLHQQQRRGQPRIAAQHHHRSSTRTRRRSSGAIGSGERRGDLRGVAARRARQRRHRQLPTSKATTPRRRRSRRPRASATARRS